MKKLVRLSLMLFAGILLITTACEKLPLNDQAAQSQAKGTGTVVMKITDAPFPVSMVAKAMVTIDNIQIRPVDTVYTSEGDTIAPGQFITLSTDTQTFNLLDLQNGLTADMVQMEIGAGTYDMIRMHVVSSKIVLTDGTEFAMKIPSGMQSGLKIKLYPSLVVEDGTVNEILVDFNLHKSFIVQGNIKSKHGIKGFLFKPVIRAQCQQQAGSVWGTVSENYTTVIPEAHVKILAADTVFSSALTDTVGKYALVGIPAGDYKMICEKDGYVSSDTVDVTVVAQEKTVQDFTIAKVDTTVSDTTGDSGTTGN